MELNMRFATIRELEIYYKWTNDPLVRSNSFNSAEVSLQSHAEWFKKKLLSEDCFLYFFSEKNSPVGQVRIERGKDENIIGISVDANYRGKSLSNVLLEMAANDFLKVNPGNSITAYIKEENFASYKSFCKAGFVGSEMVMVSGYKSYKLTKA